MGRCLIVVCWTFVAGHQGNYFSPNEPVSYSKIAFRLNRRGAAKSQWEAGSGQQFDCDKLLQATKKTTETRLAVPTKGFFRSPKSFYFTFIYPNKTKAEGQPKNGMPKKMALKLRCLFGSFRAPRSKGPCKHFLGIFTSIFHFNSTQVKSSQVNVR